MRRSSVVFGRPPYFGQEGLRLGRGVSRSPPAAGGYPTASLVFLAAAKFREQASKLPHSTRDRHMQVQERSWQSVIHVYTRLESFAEPCISGEDPRSRKKSNHLFVLSCIVAAVD